MCAYWNLQLPLISDESFTKHVSDGGAESYGRGPPATGAADTSAVTLVGPGFAEVGHKYFRSASKKRRYVYLTNWAFTIY